jgi:cyclic pyranopterin phosphate synthase
MRDGDLDDEGLYELIADRWRRRDDRYSELRALARDNESPKVEMSFIGG